MKYHIDLQLICSLIIVFTFTVMWLWDTFVQHCGQGFWMFSHYNIFLGTLSITLVKMKNLLMQPYRRLYLSSTVIVNACTITYFNVHLCQGSVWQNIFISSCICTSRNINNLLNLHAIQLSTTLSMQAHACVRTRRHTKCVMCTHLL